MYLYSTLTQVRIVIPTDYQKMRLNEKNVASFAVCSSPVDKEGYLQKKGDLNRDFQRRWFVLKGNLLFYFQKKQDREPQGVIVLEACSVQVSIHGRYSFEISFDGAGTRVYVLGADNDEDMQQWMKAISHASYEYLKSIVDELQRRVNVLSSSSAPQKDAESMEVMNVGPVASTVGVSRPPKTTKETTVTVEELRNPIAPRSKSTKIKKGILVDVSDDEAPPVPAKKKSMTMHGSGRVASGGQGVSYTDRLLLGDSDGPDGVGSSSSDKPPSHPPLSAVQSLPAPHPSPFSSPLVPTAPIENISKPLSPPSTLDRTPILQPSQAPLNDTLEAAVNKLSLKDGSESPKASTQYNGAVGKDRQFTSSEPSSHPQIPRKVAAPLDPTKSFIEMHEDFTQAMKALSADRTGGTNHSPS